MQIMQSSLFKELFCSKSESVQYQKSMRKIFIFNMLQSKASGQTVIRSLLAQLTQVMTLEVAYCIMA